MLCSIPAEKISAAKYSYSNLEEPKWAYPGFLFLLHSQAQSII